MSINRGKDFEGEVQTALEKDERTYVLRLYDPQGGYAGVANPCDFIVYHHDEWSVPEMYMLECKSLHGDRLSIYGNDPKKKYGKVSNKQWEGMLEASKHGVVAGVLIWWIDRDVTKFIPIQDLQRMREEGLKSIKYDVQAFNIEGTKKRVYFDYDFKTFFENF